MKRTPVLVLLAAATLTAATSLDRTLRADAEVYSMFFSPDGKSIVATYSDRHIRTWDVGSGKMIGDRARPLSGYLLASNILAEPTDNTQKATRIWDLREDGEMQIIDLLQGNTVISSDQKQLAIASQKERSVRLVNLNSGEQRHVLADGIGGARALGFSPDGATVVSANYDNDVRIWKTQSGKLVRKIDDLTGAMFAAAFTPDGKQLVMGGLDETVYIYDAETCALNRTLKGHGEMISAIAISPDGRTLATGGFDPANDENSAKVILWDLAIGTMTRTLHFRHGVDTLAFSPDGKWLAVTNFESKEIYLFTTASPR